MKYTEAIQMRKQALAEQKESDDWKKVRTGLNNILKTPEGVVQYISDLSMPTKHVVPYAKAVASWHPHVANTGQLEMYFSRNGKPLGYAFPGMGDGIYSDASEKQLLRARIVARLLGTDPRIAGMQRAYDTTSISNNAAKEQEQK